MASLSSTSVPETLLPSQPSKQEPTRSGLPVKYLVFILLGLSSLLYIGTAFHPALLDDADSSHALVSRAMLASHDWVVMYLNGVRYLQKSPLHFWWVAVDY